MDVHTSFITKCLKLNQTRNLFPISAENFYLPQPMKVVKRIYDAINYFMKDGILTDFGSQSSLFLHCIQN